jgi:hypothetical protein
MVEKLRQLFAWRSIDYPFEHEGYKMRDEPADLQSELDNITVFNVFMTTLLDKGARSNIQCDGKLVGKDVSVTKP